MICSKYPPMLSRLLDGELLPREIAELEGHLTQCEKCRALQASWKQQGILLRGHLQRHTLGEDFVLKACAVASRPGQEARRSENPSERRRNLLRWLPAAAAILLAAVILTQLPSNKEGVGYARVIDPGDLEVLHSSSWVRTAAGEILHAGDWLRNPVPGAAEILWHESTRLSLKAGTLAHIPDRSVQPSNQVILVNGALSSDVGDENQSFQVRTPAGSVSGSDGSFSVRVSRFSLPQLELAGDRSEILTGTTVPIGEVVVTAGRIAVQGVSASYEVLAGGKAEFSASRFASITAQPASAKATIRVVPRNASKGSLSTSLSVTSAGLRLDIEVTNISLKRLLECATGIEVHGGEDIAVAGSLRFPLKSKPEAIVSAIRTALQLPISLLQETRRQAIASVQQSNTPDSEWTQGSFRLEKFRNGLISFDFHAVPAGQAFRILRSAVNDLPELTSESESIPIMLQASALQPGEGSAFVARALGLQVRMADFQVDVIQIESESSGISIATAETPEQVARQTSGLFRDPTDIRLTTGRHPDVSEPFASPAKTQSDTVYAADAFASQPIPTAQAMHPVWSLLSVSSGAAGYRASPTPVPGNQSGIKGKVSPRVREFFGLDDMMVNPNPSIHIIWPALSADDAAGGEAAYFVTNHTGLLARTIWNGYDCEGRLIAQFGIAVNKSSTLLLLPGRDLPAFLGEGGHWETLSDIPLLGSRDGGSGGGLVLGTPVTSEQISRQKSFPGFWLGELGGHLWLVNASAEQATVILAIMQDGKALVTEQITIASNGGRLWPNSVSEIARDPSLFTYRTMVVVHALHGSVAAGPAK